MRLFHFLCLCLCLVLTSAVCHAETVTVYDLGSDNAFFAPDINAAGVVSVQTNGGCGANIDICYAEFTNGAETYFSSTPPTGFVPDDGTACAAPTGSLGQSVCNGGYHVYDLNRIIEEVFPDGNLFDIATGSADVVRLNASGDFLVIDGDAQQTYQVIVAATPEPSSIALLGTGLVGAVGMVKRRLA